MSTLKATMGMSSWDEQPLEFPGSLPNAPKMTRVKTERTLTGGLKGQGIAFYNLVYHPSDSPDPHMGTATFVGQMYFSGEIEGKGKGDIVFSGTGSYDKDAGPACKWETDPKTGTGDLVGLKATGGYKGLKGEDVTLVIQE